MQRRTLIQALAVPAAGGWAGTALAATEPLFAGKAPLRIVVGYPPGGATDRVARIVADRLQARLGSPVVVENKPGAGGPVRQLSHLLAGLRANPQQANVGVPATGSLPHFFSLMLGEAAKVQTETVGYKGSAPLITDLVGGQVPVAIDTFDVLLPQHEAGKIRVLAVSGERRSTMAPDIPTLKESGLNLSGLGWNTLFAPQSMAPDASERLSRMVQEIMKEPDTRQKFEASRLTPVSSSSAQTAEMLKAYRAQWTPVVQGSGFKP
jgi:tripartite-type tricarboxylate transporter receptor subunit TctC